MFIALCGVVVHHVEDDLDSGAMKRLHHVAEFVERAEGIPSRTVSIMWREKRQRLVSPIVAEAWRTVLFVEGKNREKLDRADAEVLEVGDLLDQPGVGATLRLHDARARMPGEPADMHLINDRFRKGSAERGIPLPVIRAGVDDNALRCRRGIVPPVPCGLTAASCRPGNTFPVRVEQHLVRVETQPPLGVEWPGNAVAVDLARGDAGDKDVPIMVGPVGLWIEIDDSSRLWGVNVVEQHQLRSCAVLGENAKIGAAGYERCSQREALASFANQVLHRRRCQASQTICCASVNIG